MIKNPLITILVLFCISLVVTTCGNKSKIKETKNVSTPTNNNSLTNRVVIVYKTQLLPDSFKTVLEKTVYDYDVKYGLLDTVFVSDSVMYYDKNIQQDDKENKENSILAVSGRKHIYINKVILDMPKFNIEIFKSTIAHELFHTLKGAEIILSSEYYIVPNYFMVGSNGLCLVMRINNSNTGFTYIEEAAAEMCAYYLYPDYKSQTYKYFHAGHVLKVMIQKKWIKPSELIEATKSSNVQKIMSSIMNKEPNELSGEDIHKIINLFIVAWKGENCRDRFIEIEELRMRK